MRLRSTRGTIVKATGAPVALTFFWSDGVPQALRSSDEGEESLRVEALGEGVFLSEDKDAGSLLLLCRPWWAELPDLRGERGYCLSYQGFHQGSWHDGVFGRWEDGAWTDLVLPGPEFRLELGRSTLPIADALELWTSEREFARKQSLIEAMRRYHGELWGARLIEQGTLRDSDFVLYLLLLRLAFPRSALQIRPRHAGFKRLAQNLNIDGLRDDARAQGETITYPSALGPEEAVLRLLTWQQQQSPFIPAHLWAELKASEKS